MSPSQQDQIREALHRESRDIHPVGLGVETVQRRGRRRRNRARTLVAVGAVACVAGVGVSVAERGSAPPHQVAVAAQSGSGSDATPSLEFRTVAGEVSFASTHLTSANGVTYELSTAPGVAAPGADPGQAIYGTSDGVHWTTAAQDKSWISDLSERDGVLYAVGTAPGSSAADVQYRVGTSHDGGSAWSDTDLPFDLTAPSASVTLTRSSFVQLASGPSATVAVLSEQFSPDLSALIAAKNPDHKNLQARMTADGYDLMDMTSCEAEARVPGASAAAAALAQKAGVGAKCTNAPVVGTITWSELGLHGASDLSREEMLVSTDGAHWDSVPAPTTAEVSNLVAGSDGFLMLADDDNLAVGTQSTGVVTTLLRSTNARDWTTVSTPAGLNVQSIAGDRIVGLDAAGDVVTSNDGGTTWNTESVGSLVPAGVHAGSVMASDVGPLGFAVLVDADANLNDQAQGPEYLLFSVDGVDWNATDLASVGEPATGYPTQVTVGADHVSVDYESGDAAPGGLSSITTLLGTPKR